MIKPYLGKFQFEFDPAYLIDRIILEHGYWEAFVLSYIKSFIKEGMLAVDIGANAGYHTLLMADLVGSQGKVYAFEPNPDTRKRLQRNLELNPDISDRVIVCSEGLGSEEKTLFLSCDNRPESMGNASLVQGNSNDQNLPIKVVKLDQYISEPVSFLKIDVEGMELEVLLGCQQHIEQDRPVVVFETLTTLPPEQHKPIEDFLKTYGYRLLVPSPNGEKLMEISYPIYPYDDCVAIFVKDN